MDNPLKASNENTGPNRPLKPGESHTWTDKNSGKQFTLKRTERDFAFDLVDCYNNARTQAALNIGIEWYVDPGGEVKIGNSYESSVAHTRKIERDREDERQRFIRNLERKDREAA